MKVFEDILKNYEARIISNDLKLSFIHGFILHNWHGSPKDRQYVDRWNIFFKHGFNPSLDLVRNSNGLLNLSAYGRRMENDVYKYFMNTLNFALFYY